MPSTYLDDDQQARGDDGDAEWSRMLKEVKVVDALDRHDNAAYPPHLQRAWTPPPSPPPMRRRRGKMLAWTALALVVMGVVASLAKRGDLTRTSATAATAWGAILQRPTTAAAELLGGSTTATPPSTALPMPTKVPRLSSSSYTPPPELAMAYLVMAHSSETLLGLSLLLAYMLNSRDLFVVHIDSNASTAHRRKVEALFAGESNVLFIPENESIAGKWGTTSLLQMELKLLERAVKTREAPQGVRWNQAIYLDGSAWPTTSLEERDNWFQSILPNTSTPTSSTAHDISFLRTTSLSFEPFCPPGHTSDEDYFCARAVARCTSSSECSHMVGTPSNGVIYKGGAMQWVRIGFTFAQYVLRHPLAIAWKDYFLDRKNQVRNADEMFFQTVFASSPLFTASTLDSPPSPSHPLPVSNSTASSRTTLAESSRQHMFIDWANTLNCPSYPNPRPGASPCYLGSKDLSDIRASEGLFSRKWWNNEESKYSLTPDFLREKLFGLEVLNT